MIDVTALRVHLDALLPLAVADLRRHGHTRDELTAMAARCGKEFSHLGDAAQWPARSSGEALGALLTGLAAAELVNPGTGHQMIALLDRRGA
ncbi:hypothetical protein DP939_02235 [Spongiactinospora rosea]|uniref:Uncharacterized protein n=1 Tax=Spongiactinospora rosea TaxID=2248750 RepID=A0A366M7M7_9ACTN|nr:hypothetical protein [Spongiactinospora rosea]RBQ21549.1 hypothetical protein DP939_02235 [Spongiactinospora rosea]